MPIQEIIVWQITSLFDHTALTLILKKFNASSQTTTDKHQVDFWRVDGITIILFKNKLMVQGSLNDNSKRLIQEISTLDGLSFDDKNAQRFVRIFPKKQNAVLCPECRLPSIIIEGISKELDIIFRRECGHTDKIHPPLLMLNRRVLPDINVLVSKSISRLINLGNFLGFEILIPHFIMNVVDQFIGPKEKSAISGEIKSLRGLEDSGKITILDYSDAVELPSDRATFEREEDNLILNIAHLTNSILITSDKNLKDKAAMQSRPVIYIPGQILEQVKIVDEIRSP